jgi:hypothetical protein
MKMWYLAKGLTIEKDVHNQFKKTLIAVIEEHTFQILQLLQSAPGSEE